MKTDIECKGHYNLAIMGAGASGIAAALTVKKLAPQLSTVIFEKKERAARKLAATGNGRCNISNSGCGDLETVREFLEDVGIILRQESDGRLYPYCEDAQNVAELMLSRAAAAGAEILLNNDVKRVEADRKGGFLLFVEEKGEQRLYSADRLLIAAGGKSYPSMGTTGDGYALARRLGHSVTALAPGLTAVCVRGSDAEELRRLAGTRVKGSARLFFANKELACERGELQFRRDSLSGICIMNLSNLIKPRRRAENGAAAETGLSFEGYRIELDMADGLSAEELKRYLRRVSRKEAMSCADILRPLLKDKAAGAVLARLGLTAEAEASALDEARLAAAADLIKAFSFEVEGLAGWKEAQVTCGGVYEDEVDPNTMESRLLPGLYFCGEVLDYAGPCGGYNLHHAWLTGLYAGRAIAESSAKPASGQEANDK